MLIKTRYFTPIQKKNLKKSIINLFILLSFIRVAINFFLKKKRITFISFVPMPYKKRTRKTPSYIQKIGLDTIDNNNRRIRKKPKLCPYCKETNDYIKLLSGKVSRIEEIVDDFHKNLPTKNPGPVPMEIDNPLGY